MTHLTHFFKKTHFSHHLTSVFFLSTTATTTTISNLHTTISNLHHRRLPGHPLPPDHLRHEILLHHLLFLLPPNPSLCHPPSPSHLFSLSLYHRHHHHHLQPPPPRSPTSTIAAFPATLSLPTTSATKSFSITYSSTTLQIPASAANTHCAFNFTVGPAEKHQNQPRDADQPPMRLLSVEKLALSPVNFRKCWRSPLRNRRGRRGILPNWHVREKEEGWDGTENRGI